MQSYTSSISLLENEFACFEQYLQQVLEVLFFNVDEEYSQATLVLEALQAFPDLPHHDNLYSHIIHTFAEEDQLYIRIILLLALAPYFRPELLDVFIVKNEATGAIYTELGGRLEQNPAKFRPTLQTVFFLLSSNRLENRVKLARFFSNEEVFHQQNILYLQSSEDQLSRPSLHSEILVPTEECLALLKGQTYLPKLSTSFPAEPISTPLEWKDLVLAPETLEHLEEIIAWMQHQEETFANPVVAKQVKPGFRVLFYGTSGTGKSLTAALLGKRLNMPVLRIHSAMLTSKFVGETEKNLDRMFEAAEGKQWILLFDEGENFFGQRSAAGGTAQDHYVNQQLGYMLQRIETYNGLVIVSTNRKVAMDKAFKRRFQAMIQFQDPKETQRYLLWEKAFTGVTFCNKVDLKPFSEKYPEMTGGILINVLNTALSKMYREAKNEMNNKHLQEAVMREYKKLGLICSPLFSQAELEKI